MTSIPQEALKALIRALEDIEDTDAGHLEGFQVAGNIDGAVWRAARAVAGLANTEWITRDAYEAIVSDGISNDKDAGGKGDREYVESYLRPQYRIIGEDGR